MFDSTLDKNLTIKYLQYLTETATSILVKPEILREDMDSIQREFGLFKDRVLASSYLPEDLKKDVQAINLDVSPVFGHGSFTAWVRLFILASSLRSSNPMAYSQIKGKDILTDFRNELDSVLTRIESYRFWR